MKANEVLLIQEQPGTGQANLVTVTEGVKLVGRRIDLVIVGPTVSPRYVETELLPRMSPMGQLIRVASLDSPVDFCRPTKTVNLHELVGLVRHWGEDKGITGPNGKATLISQLCKTQEELDETADAASRLLLAEAGAVPDAESIKDEVKDGIGDQAVTLILAAELAGLTFEDCLQAAYDQIKSRKGTMVNGQFVKEAEA